MGSLDIPSQQRAAIRQGVGPQSTTSIKSIPVPQPGPGQILVKVNWSGLCGSDKSLLHNEWKDFGLSMMDVTEGIAGHEGAGPVVAVGAGMENRWKVGDRAGVKWIASTCGECEFCLNGVDEVHCPKQTNSGFSTPGTFQEYVIADGRLQAVIKPGQWIVLPGAGGGLGHFAVQYARAMGMRVIAIDGGDHKRELCKKLGAEVFIDFKETKDIAAEIMKITTYGAHGVIVTAATRAAYESAPSFLRPNGTVVAVGLPQDPTIVAGTPPMTMVLRRLNIVGSVVGSLKEVEEALDFTARGLVRPILSKGKLEELDEWVHKLATGQVAGRCVLQVAE
ncbi:hypothetical protein ACJ41O_003522 [Fusarium nematophilum]